MNQEQVQLTYELITNPILRLLVWFLASAVAGLVIAVVYLYKDRQSATRELTDINNEAVRGYTLVGKSLEAMKEQIDDLQHSITEHLIKNK